MIDLTWQVAGGATYAALPCLRYEAGNALQNLNFNGPMIGATFRR
jgi:hypothetical protein